MLKHLSEQRTRGVELSVALVDDDTIQELNRSFRRKNRPTDVLAFPLADEHVPHAPAGMLGDVVLSVPTARRQARARRRSLLEELTMLLAHGLLHLCGYDHRTDAEERVMTGRTEELCEVARRRRRPKTPSRRRPTAPRRR